MTSMPSTANMHRPGRTSARRGHTYGDPCRVFRQAAWSLLIVKAPAAFSRYATLCPANTSATLRSEEPTIRLLCRPAFASRYEARGPAFSGYAQHTDGKHHGKGELREPGVRELSLALDPDMEFEKFVDVLREQLTFKFPRGCAPCLSGLDRLTIDSVVFERLQQRF